MMSNILRTYYGDILETGRMDLELTGKSPDNEYYRHSLHYIFNQILFISQSLRDWLYNFFH
jgi:hypothetical protein